MSRQHKETLLAEAVLDDTEGSGKRDDRTSAVAAEGEKGLGFRGWMKRGKTRKKKLSTESDTK